MKRFERLERFKRFERLLLCLALLLIPLNVYSADVWTPTNPQGSDSASSLDTIIQANNEALERLNHSTRNGMTVIEKDAASVYAMPGQIAIGNSAGTVYRFREITSATAVPWTSLDTGSEATSTQYYVYAVADTADSAACTFVMSEHATTPTGTTYYRKIGYFYNNSSGNVINVGNIDVNPISNSVDAIGTSDVAISTGTYTLLDDMTVYFVSNGRPLLVMFEGSFQLTQNGVKVRCDIGGTDKSPDYIYHSEAGGSYVATHDMTYVWYEDSPTAGPLTVTVDWSGVGTQMAGTNDTDRKLVVWEL